MPGILAIIEDVAADPDVESSVGKLVEGLFAHLKDAMATNNSAAVEEAANQIVANKEALSAAVTANTPAAPPAPEPSETDTTADAASDTPEQAPAA